MSFFLRTFAAMKGLRLVLLAVLGAVSAAAWGQLETEAVRRAKAERAAADAERAAQEARRAADKVREERRRIVDDMGLKDLEPADSVSMAQWQEELRIRQLEREQRRMRERERDSVRTAEGMRKMRLWRRGVFVGADVGTNFCMADNITDHPPFKWREAWGGGLGVQVGMMFSRVTGARAGLSLHTARNRWGREMVQAWQYGYVYKGNGFYRFSVAEITADALFDVSGLKNVEVFRPLHVYMAVGAALVATGKKEMEERDHGFGPEINQNTGEETEYIIVAPKDDEGHVVRKGEYTPFGNTVDTGRRVDFGVRGNVLVDYRFSRHCSATMELGATVTGDHFDGINYDEPFDIFWKVAAGLKWWF